MTSNQTSSTPDLTHVLSEIGSALAKSQSAQPCVACHRPCRSVRDVRIEHDDFSLTVPLWVCQRCARRPPFPPDSLLALWSAIALAVCVPMLLLATPLWPFVTIYLLALIGALIWQRRRRANRARTGPTLRSLLETVPPYRALMELFPQLSVNCASHDGFREAAGGSEAQRFSNSIHLRRTSSYLMTEAEFAQSGMALVVLGSYVDIVDAQMKRLGASLPPRSEMIAQAAAVLLPGRQWRFDVQIVAPSRRVPRERLSTQLRESLASLPSWPVSYPVVFVARREFGNTSAQLFKELQQPFDSWPRQLPASRPLTHGQRALQVYGVELPQQPCVPEAEDGAALRQRLPESIPLAIFHADLLRILGRNQEALEIYDATRRQLPGDEAVFFRRIGCLAAMGQLERAAAECQQRIAQHPKEAHAYMVLAELQYQFGLAGEALKTIDQALALRETAELLRIRAAILAEVGRTAEAADAVNAAIFRDRDCASAYILRARLHLNEDRRKEALADLAEHDRCAGISLESLSLKAAALLAEGRVHEAESAYQAAVAVAPQNLDLRLQWAEFLGQIGKVESALQECDRVIARAERFAAAYAVRGAVALEMGHFDESVRNTDQAIRLGADGPKTYLVRGLGKAARGDLEQALEDVNVCVSKAPNLALARYHKGRLHAGLGEYGSAVSEFSAALEIVPGWTDAYVQRGYALLALEEHAEARSDFEQALERSPQLSDAYTGRAITQLADGNKAAAAEDLNKALALDPNNLRGRLHRAAIFLEQAETELAKEDLNEILAAEPSFEPALWQRAHVHLLTGQFAEAKQDFDRLIEINPEQPRSLIGRSVAFELAGDIEHAEADREEALRLAPLSSEELAVTQVLLTASVANSNEQFDKAVELVTKLIDEHPDPPSDAYRIRAHAHWYTEHFVEALDDYSHVLEDAEEATRHDFSAFGQILGELGEFDKGLETLDRAVQMARQDNDPVGLAFSLNGRGRALIGLGRVREAEEAFTESLRLKADNAWLHFNRGLMYYEQGQATHALACFELALCMESPKLPPAKRRRATGFIQRLRNSGEDARKASAG